MVELLNLEKIGGRLRKIDQQIITLLSQRMKLSLQVEQWKEAHNQPILRLEVEEKRLTEIATWAKEKGVNPNFARAMLYFIIRESCAIQVGYLQDEDSHEIEPQNELEWQKQLKNNLLSLTAKIATSYDLLYEKGFFATHAYLDFESRTLEKEVGLMKDTDIALDVGCATGRIGLKLSPLFNQIIGYDVSPEMIGQAKAKIEASSILNARFEVIDVENGIPQKDASISLVTMNMGTASDIRPINELLSEIERVLKPGGRFLLSFYNAGALFYRWFIPWPISLAAEINLTKHCLDVHWDEKVYSIFARPYSTEEVKTLIPKAFTISSVLTYPTISSILPNELFEEEIVQTSIIEIDEKLSDLSLGAYVLVAGVKE